MNKPYLPILFELKKNQETVDKYEHPGIYSITIAGKLAYIGKSTDMLCRLAQHIYYTDHPNEATAHKYLIFSLAKLFGYDITFDVIYLATGTKDQIDDEIGFKEGELIRQYYPPLNYQIPDEKDYRKFTVNENAKTVKLQDIILGKAKKIIRMNFE